MRLPGIARRDRPTAGRTLTGASAQSMVLSMRRSIATSAAALALVVVAVLAGAGGASAAPAPTAAELALMPLPQRALGASYTRFAQDAASSGVLSNAAVASLGTFSPARLKGFGRQTGYKLVYQRGKESVDLGVELLKRSNGAATYLARKRASAKAFDFSVGAAGHRFDSVEVDFRDGLIVGSVGVTLKDAANSAARANALARALRARIDAVLAGRVKGRPVPLGTPPAFGPPAGGPDLTGMCVTPGDLPRGAALAAEGYVDPHGTAASFRRAIDLSGVATKGYTLAAIGCDMSLERSTEDATLGIAALRAYLPTATAFTAREVVRPVAVDVKLMPLPLGKVGDEAFATTILVRGPAGAGQIGFACVRVAKVVATLAFQARAGKLDTKEMSSLAGTLAARMRSRL